MAHDLRRLENKENAFILLPKPDFKPLDFKIEDTQPLDLTTHKDPDLATRLQKQRD